MRSLCQPKSQDRAHVKVVGKVKIAHRLDGCYGFPPIYKPELEAPCKRISAFPLPSLQKNVDFNLNSYYNFTWPDGGPIAQLVEPPAHNRQVVGSTPTGPTTTSYHSLVSWGVSSVGRAPSSHGGSHWFKPSTPHHYFTLTSAETISFISLS